MTGSRALPVDARAAVLDWFESRGRALPFRRATDPYAVLVLETMAQQTQIARASEKWASFMVRFPTVQALASAAPADVLREWRGLGYNRRALLLWRAAQVICREHHGRVPDELSALERLPGIGAYTARAVAAVAHGQAVGPVDTNVRRVLSRAIAGDAPLSVRELQAIADRSVPAGRAAEWAHALMDIGATLCRRAEPACAACPLATWCASAGSRGANRPPPRRRSGNSRAAAFPATTRWLRGRLLDRLRDAVGDDWVRIDGQIGAHDTTAVDTALGAMAADGLVERHPEDAFLVRLPVA